jgi:hypothetical protein
MTFRRLMRLLMGTGLFALAACAAGAADVPRADAEYRAKYTKENMSTCIGALENEPELRALYSHKTVEVYCQCKQGYRADVLANAIKLNQRGKEVSDRAADYSHAQCKYILIGNLEAE